MIAKNDTAIALLVVVVKICPHPALLFCFVSFRMTLQVRIHLEELGFEELPTERVGG